MTDSKIDAQQARIAISGDTVYVVWRGEKGNNFQGSDIYMRVSKNSGKDFGSTKNLSNNPVFSTDPVIKASGNNVYVGWLEDTSGDLDNFEVMFKRSTNKGDSFGGTKNLSNTSDDSSQVVISTSDPVVYVAWKEGSFPSNDIMLKRSTDRGSHFGSRINVSNDPIESNTPVMG